MVFVMVALASMFLMGVDWIFANLVQVVLGIGG
jgi:preprotein translocase subunit SecE